MISFRVTSRPVLGITPIENEILVHVRNVFKSIYQDNVVVMMIYIRKENTNTVHPDRLLHNNEYFHHPKNQMIC